MFSVVYDGGSFIDSFCASTLGDAKAAALDVLLEWECSFHQDNPGKLSEWSEDVQDEWDRMIYECSVFVKDGNNEIAWEPSDEDYDFLCWQPYEELLKKFTKKAIQ